MPEDTTKKANALIHESSPYLQQHAYNPVDWLPWSEAAFDKAKKEDKLVLVSIGYSSCHWCHVMEHESFEDTAVAAIMNKYFVCIKVDREERPDVDQIYMTAVQLMSGTGGWPLNCFTLSDGRPVFGGTYFPKNNWVNILEKLHESFINDREKFEEYAEQLKQGIAGVEVIEKPEPIQKFSRDKVDEMMVIWKRSFDNTDGGNNRAPKFPMPNNYEFMMAYAQQYLDTVAMEHVDRTLKKMALGGIYDQIGGGFARYSTDMIWKVPHFEKMLYDNAQLISLYSKAYQRNKSPLYKEVVEQTIEWARREMLTDEGCFYSALDADSEGEEGKFYVWSVEELKQLLGDDYELAETYFSIGSRTAWEGNHILMRADSDEEVIQKHQLNEKQFEKKKTAIYKVLMDARDKRVRPGLDDKALTAWNAMMVVGLADAYEAFKDEKYLELALKNANWLADQQMREDGGMYHTYKNGISTIDGFLDDYSFTCEAFVKLYEVTFDEKWLTKAKQLVQYARANFYDEKSGMFFFTSSKGEQLIARKMEISDNVIPASNSSMGKALFRLGWLIDDKSMIQSAEQMLSNMYDGMEQYGSSNSNWGQLTLLMAEPFYQVAVCGKDWKKLRSEFGERYLPNVQFMGGEQGSLPALEGKFVKESTIYVCVDYACQMPVSNVHDALNQIK